MEHQAQGNLDRARDAVVNAAETILRQVARMLVGKVSFTAISDMMQRIYVEEAEKKIRHEQVMARGKVPRAAISLVTGLDSRRIAASQNQTIKTIIEKDVLSRPEVQVIVKWEGDPKYLNPVGKPKSLTYLGNNSEFYKLIKDTGNFYGLTPHSILTSLISAGCVEYSVNHKLVTLTNTTFIPVNADTANIIGTGSDAAGRLLRTVVHNANVETSVDDRRFQQQRWSTRIPPEKINEFRQGIRGLLNECALKTEHILDDTEDQSDQSGQYEAGIGLYYFENTPEDK